MRDLDKPVHLYVKKHNWTGLKYFGRTTEDPYDYRGSGAYWTRHLAKYGNDVTTKVIGTYTDSNQLRLAAQSFSAKKNITSSTKWANLLGEDGGVSGEGWLPSTDHHRRIAALDAAVERRLHEAQETAEGDAQPRPTARPASVPPTTSSTTSSSRNPVVWVLVGAAIVGVIWFFNSSSTSSPVEQPQAESCGDWLSAAVKTERADSWVEPTASEFMEAFSTRCGQEYRIWVDWQSIWNRAAEWGVQECSEWAQYSVQPESIELARRDGSCRGS